jgi:hypothetical protein
MNQVRKMKRRFILADMTREEESLRLISSAKEGSFTQDTEALASFRSKIKRFYREHKEEMEADVIGSCSCFRGDFYNPPETCDNCYAEADLEELNAFTSQLPESLFNTLDLPGVSQQEDGTKVIRNKAFYFNLPTPFYGLGRSFYSEYQADLFPAEIKSYWKGKPEGLLELAKNEYLNERLNYEAQYLIYHNFCYQVALALHPEADYSEVIWYSW